MHQLAIATASTGHENSQTNAPGVNGAVHRVPVSSLRPGHWARVDGERPAPHRFAARIYEDVGAVDLAEEAAQRAAERGPSDAGAWERLGRLRLRMMDREGALEASPITAEGMSMMRRS